MRLIKIFAGALLTLGISSIQAAPIVTLGELGAIRTTVSGASEYTFDGFECPYANCSGDFAILSGSTGQAARPFGAESNWLTVPYNNLPGSATFGLGFDADYFGLYWGSIDAYNSIAFYNDVTLVGSFSGSDLVGAFANGSQVSFNSNRFINFQFAAGAIFNKIVMTSTNWAFESDNHAVANINNNLKIADVPEPASILLMLLGMAGLGSTRRRRT
jgi:hypothetical protein